MATLCPICNGLTSLQASCEHCGSPIEDNGRLNDLYGPYSPYREIDHLKLTNGYSDLAHQQCIHVAYCPNCSHQQLSFTQEIES